MKHILLIDDNEIDNFINKKIVSKSLMADLITVLNSGIDAIEFLTNLIMNNEPFPELIFLDIQMPEMDGFQFLHQFDNFPEEMKVSTSINMLTSSSNSNDIKRASECRYVKNFFNKPLSAGELDIFKTN
ncbi:MAG: response regulator [bacterium]|nr:response regulator [bacterium]